MPPAAPSNWIATGTTGLPDRRPITAVPTWALRDCSAAWK